MLRLDESVQVDDGLPLRHEIHGPCTPNIIGSPWRWLLPVASKNRPVFDLGGAKWMTNPFSSGHRSPENPLHSLATCCRRMCWHASLIAWNLFVTAMAKKMFSRHDSINRFFLEKVSAAVTHSLSVSEGCIAEIILKPTVHPWKSMVGSWKMIHFLWGKRPISGVNLLFVSVSVSCNYSSGNDHMGPTKREVGKIVDSKSSGWEGICDRSQPGMYKFPNWRYWEPFLRRRSRSSGERSAIGLQFRSLAPANWLEFEVKPKVFHTKHHGNPRFPDL